MFPCPCCGYEVFSEPPGSYEICPICYWEDDIVQLAFPEMAGGANCCSLIEGQANFAQYCACDRRFKENVRVPLPSELRQPMWRMLDAQRDRYLKWSSKTDIDAWQDVNRLQIPCLYYWSSEYWLSESEAED